MVHTTLLLVHICGAVVGILSGFLSMMFRKGAGLHRAAGAIFVVSMLIMSAAGAYIAVFIKPNAGNVVGGILTFYLVATGWKAGRRREQTVGMFDVAALLLIATLATTDLIFGFQALASPTHTKAGYPPALFFIFGSIAALFAASDVRMIIRRGLTGTRRIARHLWRMSLALLIAALSFYPSRAHLFSKPINDSRVLYLPHAVLVVATVYWLIRVSVRRRAPRVEAETTPMPTSQRGAAKLWHA